MMEQLPLTTTNMKVEPWTSMQQDDILLRALHEQIHPNPYVLCYYNTL